MNISSITHEYTHNEVASDADSRSNSGKKNAKFNIFDISNHEDKIVPKNMDFRNEFHFEGTADDLKALRGNILEMDSLHLAKARRAAPIDKQGLLESDDCDSEIDDFEDDREWLDTYDMPLKRLSSQGRSKIHRIVEEDKTTTKEDFRQRVKESLGMDSMHLNRERLEECN
mmetsp:Transcript_19567/g.48179  ORF Transcript_19567/g.48179 Transcript_19567/m.48179 type:complete len:171 (+) Transcript_19567:68-580(+)|eukprot:CAMPEP_0113607546 /NCGR_PEP_ID=MMETSP0017_2-20120614/3443_1 /TAXON_ID=2856 /ORGANISM="Cylindrotheca closterium" /LENGTH=170 /DNA_ID=CAMNT_0000516159 /DNA_START=68 /DNA_END=580 /DNA_ORIENTATION=+ /assembly_acc=CAM_ASM_000147